MTSSWIRCWGDQDGFWSCSWKLQDEAVISVSRSRRVDRIISGSFSTCLVIFCTHNRAAWRGVGHRWSPQETTISFFLAPQVFSTLIWQISSYTSKRKTKLNSLAQTKLNVTISVMKSERRKIHVCAWELHTHMYTLQVQTHVPLQSKEIHDISFAITSQLRKNN